MESILTSLLSVAAESALLPALMGAVVGDDRPQKAPTEGAHRKANRSVLVGGRPRRPRSGAPSFLATRAFPPTTCECTGPLPPVNSSVAPRLRAG